jgi:hypothetical protein
MEEAPMSADQPVEKKFKILIEICRASHFAWREAVTKICPEADPREVVEEMWRITGVQTAEAYLKRLDPSGDLPRQVAESVVWSSLCMGEAARVESAGKEGEYLVLHDSCPWHRWHARMELLEEDRPGCDRWFESMIALINDKLGRKVRFETICALPEGDDACVRRIWE